MSAPTITDAQPARAGENFTPERFWLASNKTAALSKTKVFKVLKLMNVSPEDFARVYVELPSKRFNFKPVELNARQIQIARRFMLHRDFKLVRTELGGQATTASAQNLIARALQQGYLT